MFIVLHTKYCTLHWTLNTAHYRQWKLYTAHSIWGCSIRPCPHSSKRYRDISTQNNCTHTFAHNSKLCISDFCHNYTQHNCSKENSKKHSWTQCNCTQKHLTQHKYTKHKWAPITAHSTKNNIQTQIKFYIVNILATANIPKPQKPTRF